MEIEQRSEAYRAYVSDSLFFLQHLFGGGEDDDKRIFNYRLIEILNGNVTPADNEEDLSSENVIKKMRDKARSMQ